MSRLFTIRAGRPFARFDSKRQTLAGTGIPRRVSRVVYESLVGFFITTLPVFFHVVVVGVVVLVGFRVERHLQGEVGRVVDAVQSDDDAQDTDDRFDEEDENVSE